MSGKRKGRILAAVVFTGMILSVILVLCGKTWQEKTALDSQQEKEESGNAQERADESDGNAAESGEGEAVAETGTFSVSGEKEPDTGTGNAEERVTEQAERILASMTLEEKAAQLFFVTPESLTGYSRVTAAGENTEKALLECPVGGIVYFAQNLENPAQTTEMLARTQQYAQAKHGIPLFLGVDEEGGRVRRIGKNAEFGVERVEAMGTLAESGDENAIYQAGNTVGAYLADLGFNVDFAPDADVLTNAENQVIGDRSFGTDADTVAQMAWEFTRGLHENRILAAYKHFPGHGGTVEDSHTGYAYLHKTMEELREAELVPFLDGCRRGVDFIMVSHISAPEVTGDDTPASMSSVFVQELLRDEMGYEGIIITDSYSMGAITEHYPAGEAAVLSIEAGCDMILMPQDLKEAHTAVLNAVAEGRISEARIDESVRRILKAKIRWAEAS